MKEDVFVDNNGEGLSKEAEEWLYGESGDELAGRQYTVQENESEFASFDPAVHCGWHLVACTGFEDDPENVFGERSKYAGERAPKLSLTWQIISMGAIGLEKSPHPDKEIQKNDPAEGIQIMYDDYYLHPATMYATNELAKALRLPYTVHPTRKHKRTGEPLRAYVYSEKNFLNAVCVAYIDERMGYNQETGKFDRKTGFPQIAKPAGKPIVQPVFPDGEWKTIKIDGLPF